MRRTLFALVLVAAQVPIKTLFKHRAVRVLRDPTHVYERLHVEVARCVVTMDRNLATFSKPCTTENDRMYRQKYGTGIEFEEGDQIGIATTSSVQFFELRGYLTDIT